MCLNDLKTLNLIKITKDNKPPELSRLRTNCNQLLIKIFFTVYMTNYPLHYTFQDYFLTTFDLTCLSH